MIVIIISVSFINKSNIIHRYYYYFHQLTNTNNVSLSHPAVVPERLGATVALTWSKL